LLKETHTYAIEICIVEAIMEEAVAEVDARCRINNLSPIRFTELVPTLI